MAFRVERMVQPRGSPYYSPEIPPQPCHGPMAVGLGRVKHEKLIPVVCARSKNRHNFLVRIRVLGMILIAQLWLGQGEV